MKDFPPNPMERGVYLLSDELKEYRALGQRVMRKVSYLQATESCNGYDKTIRPLIAAINQATATTVAGLMVKAEALVWEANSISYSPHAADWEVVSDEILGLITAIYAVGNQPSASPFRFRYSPAPTR
jgi:hypothetical protein